MGPLVNPNRNPTCPRHGRCNRSTYIYGPYHTAITFEPLCSHIKPEGLTSSPLRGPTQCLVYNGPQWFRLYTTSPLRGSTRLLDGSAAGIGCRVAPCLPAPRLGCLSRPCRTGQRVSGCQLDPAGGCQLGGVGPRRPKGPRGIFLLSASCSSLSRLIASSRHCARPGFGDQVLVIER